MDDEKRLTVTEFAEVLWKHKDIIQKMTPSQVDKIIEMLRRGEKKTDTVA